ncbi:hypothetical protein [Mesorhizobium sp. B2-8-9]|uniref:hypothetical protein n=1 Tax=Mesorhizobium sp. B2-8-9 TaxID=2589899 RepID=UPI001125E8BB|nr:hypothetical protein [Mesorhizobium sp. B2-8-9]TPI71796.1 hypothetical protein FJ423_28560 [Mesorhizobium sp. B2-8-9]
MSDKYQARKTESVGLTQPNATSPTWQRKLERFHLKSGRDLSAIKPAGAGSSKRCDGPQSLRSRPFNRKAINRVTTAAALRAGSQRWKIGDDQYRRMVQVLHDPWQAGN